MASNIFKVVKRIRNFSLGIRLVRYFGRNSCETISKKFKNKIGALSVGRNCPEFASLNTEMIYDMLKRTTAAEDKTFF